MCAHCQCHVYRVLFQTIGAIVNHDILPKLFNVHSFTKNMKSDVKDREMRGVSEVNMSCSYKERDTVIRMAPLGWQMSKTVKVTQVTNNQTHPLQQTHPNKTHHQIIRLLRNCEG